MRRTPVLPPLPMLNTSMILDLIQWAEVSEGRKSILQERFPNWGKWDQGNWGSLTNNKKKALNVNDLPRVPLEADGGVCQTSYCMAGQAAVQSEYRLLYGTTIVDGQETVYADRAMPQRPTGEISPRGWAIWGDVPGADSVPIELAGQRSLGLTDAEADIFFGGDNGLDDLKMMANRFAVARGLPVIFTETDVWDDYDDDDDDPRLDYGNYAEPAPQPAFTAPAPIASQASVPAPA